MFIRHVKVKPPAGGKATRLWPPEGVQPTGSATVTVIAEGALVLLDDPGQAEGEGLAMAAKAERTLALGQDELWATVASGEQTAVVIGTLAPF